MWQIPMYYPRTVQVYGSCSIKVENLVAAPSLLESPYHCPIIVHNKGNEWALIGQYQQGKI